MPKQEIAEERRAPIRRENRNKSGEHSISDDDAAALDSLAKATTETAAPAESEAAPESAQDTPEPTTPEDAEEEVSEQPAKAVIGQPSEPETPDAEEPHGEESTDDEAVAISKAEFEKLQRGNMMQADYTRKTQSLSAKDKELEAERVRVRESLGRYDDGLKQLEEVLTTAVPKEPNWAEERARRPADDYAKLRDEWDVFSKNLQAVRDERKKVADARAEDLRKQWESRISAEKQKVLDAKPELLDESRYTAWTQRIVQTAKSLGFSDEEIAGPIQVDSRICLMLDKLAQQTDTRTPITKKPPVPKSVPPAGAQGSPRATTKIEQLRDRLAKSAKGNNRGANLEAAGALFDSLLSKKA